MMEVPPGKIFLFVWCAVGFTTLCYSSIPKPFYGEGFLDLSLKICMIVLFEITELLMLLMLVGVVFFFCALGHEGIKLSNIAILWGVFLIILIGLILLLLISNPIWFYLGINGWTLLNLDMNGSDNHINYMMNRISPLIRERAMGNCAITLGTRLSPDDYELNYLCAKIQVYNDTIGYQSMLTWVVATTFFNYLIIFPLVLYRCLLAEREFKDR